VCGVGAAWFEQEHRAYGWDFPPVSRRFQLLEDALRLLPLMWGRGSPSFEGSVVNVPEAVCYPRPLQERIPILVGGSGERRTLRLVAEHADACNLFGDVATVRHKLDVLRAHCADVKRDPGDIRVTHLSTVLVTDDAVDRVPPRTVAGTMEDHVGRFRELAEAGVQTAIVRLADLDEGSVERFAAVIDAFR
jgi:alkanesulfonate monooxygenase SsuD/methylene tetrahydromethanopterin reductase-like flavin-dependent oxidoreductase (luciferase family)